MEKTELKPCPFCGSDSLRKQITAWPRYITCNGCGAEQRSGLIDDEGIDDVIRKWNRRANDEKS